MTNKNEIICIQIYKILIERRYKIIKLCMRVCMYERKFSCSFIYQWVYNIKISFSICALITGNLNFFRILLGPIVRKHYLCKLMYLWKRNYQPWKYQCKLRKEIITFQIQYLRKFVHGHFIPMYKLRGEVARPVNISTMLIMVIIFYVNEWIHNCIICVSTRCVNVNKL